MKTSYNRTLIFSALILLFYMAVRFFVYRQFSIESENDWLFRDSIMDVPRILCFLMCLRLFTSLEKKEFFAISKTNISILIGIAFLILLRPVMSLKYETFSASFEYILISGASSIIVAIFEESLFRVLIYDSLKNLIGEFLAIIGSAVIFMGYHYQAQGFQYFPILFLYGILFAIFRGLGASLFWLILCHALIDILVPVWNSANTELWIQTETLSLFLISVVFLIWLFLQRNKLSENWSQSR